MNTLINNLAFRVFIIDIFNNNLNNTNNIYKKIAYKNAIDNIINFKYDKLTNGMKNKINNYYRTTWKKKIFVNSGPQLKEKNVPRHIADEIIKFIKNKIIDRVKKFDVCGSYNRGEKYMHDIDIIVICKNNFKSDIIDILYKYITILRSGDNMISFLYNGVQVDITNVKNEDEYVFMFMHCNGPKEFNIKLRKHAKKMGYKLNQYGLWKNKKKIKKKFIRKSDILKYLKY